MKTKTIIVLSLFLLIFGCSSTKKIVMTTDETLQEVVINIAIQDFSTKCNLFKKDSVFSVFFHDSVFSKPTLIPVNNGEYKDGRTHQWTKGNLIDGIVSVEIGSNDGYQLYYSEQTKSKLPTRYIIKDTRITQMAQLADTAIKQQLRNEIMSGIEEAKPILEEEILND